MKKYQHLFKLAVLNTFIVPNTFSMEGDNIQDEFLIEGDNIQDELLIVRENIQDASTQTDKPTFKKVLDILEFIKALIEVLIVVLACDLYWEYKTST